MTKHLMVCCGALHDTGIAVAAEKKFPFTDLYSLQLLSKEPYTPESFSGIDQSLTAIDVKNITTAAISAAAHAIQSKLQKVANFTCPCCNNTDDVYIETITYCSVHSDCDRPEACGPDIIRVIPAEHYRKTIAEMEADEKHLHPLLTNETLFLPGSLEGREVAASHQPEYLDAIIAELLKTYSESDTLEVVSVSLFPSLKLYLVLKQQLQSMPNLKLRFALVDNDALVISAGEAILRIFEHHHRSSEEMLRQIEQMCTSLGITFAAETTEKDQFFKQVNELSAFIADQHITLTNVIEDKEFQFKEFSITDDDSQYHLNELFPLEIENEASFLCNISNILNMDSRSHSQENLLKWMFRYSIHRNSSHCIQSITSCPKQNKISTQVICIKDIFNGHPATPVQVAATNHDQHLQKMLQTGNLLLAMHVLSRLDMLTKFTHIEELYLEIALRKTRILGAQKCTCSLKQFAADFAKGIAAIANISPDILAQWREHRVYEIDEDNLFDPERLNREVVNIIDCIKQLQLNDNDPTSLLLKLDHIFATISSQSDASVDNHIRGFFFSQLMVRCIATWLLGKPQAQLETCQHPENETVITKILFASAHEATLAQQLLASRGLLPLQNYLSIVHQQHENLSPTAADPTPHESGHPPKKNKIDSVLVDTSSAAKKNRPEPTLGTIGMFTKSSPNPEIDVTLAAAEPETTLSPSF